MRKKVARGVGGLGVLALALILTGTPPSFAAPQRTTQMNSSQTRTSSASPMPARGLDRRVTTDGTPIYGKRQKATSEGIGCKSDAPTFLEGVGWGGFAVGIEGIGWGGISLGLEILCRLGE